MKCQKCNFLNPPGSIYCAACGAVLEEEIEIVDDIIVDDVIVDDVTTPIMQQAPTVQPTMQEQVTSAIPVNPVMADFNTVEAKPVYNSQQVSSNLSFIDLLMMVIAVLIKPMSILRKHSANFELPKTAFILNGIVSFITTLGLLILAIISEIKVVEYSLFGPAETTWVFENIKNVDYSNVLYNIIGFMIGNMIIALVFFIGTKLFKKEVSYFKLLSVISLASSPMVIGTLLISILFFAPYQVLLGLGAVSSIYFVILLVHFINATVKFDDENSAIYYMIASYGTVSILGTILISIWIEENIMPILSSFGL